MFRITRKNYLDSARTEHLLKQKAFLTYSWRFLRSHTLEQLEFKLEKMTGILKYAEKVSKGFFS